MLLTPDEKLIHSILQGGLDSYYEARRLGVRSEILYEEGRSIWDLMERMSGKGRLPSLPEIQTVTGQLITEVCPDPLAVDICAESVVKRGLITQLHSGVDGLADRVTEDPLAARDEIIELAKKTAWSYGEPYSINSRSCMDELIKAYEKAAQRGNRLLGLSSPWPTVDEVSLGLQNGELTVVFAKRKVGKSWIVIAWAVHIWRNDLKPGEKLLFVTMEMTPLQVLRRMACIDLHFAWDDFRGGRLTSAERKRMDDWVDARMNADPSEANVIIVGSNQVRTIKDLDAIVGEHKPKGVIVDSFYIMGRASGASIYERVLANVQGLKLDVALKHEVPVLASTQLKGTTSADVLNADSDQAMGAKAIGDYADATRGLFVNETLKADGKRYWRGMEAREFEAKDVEINFDFQTMDFSEIREIDPDEMPGDSEDGDDDDDDKPQRKGKRVGRGKGKSKSPPPLPPVTSSDDDNDLIL